MKKNAAKMGVLVLAGSAFLATTGCGMTTEKILDKMQDQEMESFSSVSDVDFGFKLGMSGVDFKITASGEYDMNVESASDEEASVYGYVDMNVNIPVTGKMPIETEFYSIMDGDEVEVYALNPDSDTWVHSVQEVEEAMLDEDVRKDLEKAVRKVLDQAELQKETEKVDGDECYVLKLNTGLDAFKEVYEIIYDYANEMSEDKLEEELDDADLSIDDVYDLMKYINMDLTIYASKSDGYCRRIVVDFTESDLQTLFEEFCDLAGVDPQDEWGVEVESVEFSSFSIDMTFNDINDTTVKVPKDVTNEAIDMDLENMIY
jgi:hypothetical protein